MRRKTITVGIGPVPPRRVLLVAPRHPPSFWTMQGTVELFGAKTLMPNPALATLIALTPEDVRVEYRLCEQNVGDTLPHGLPLDLVAVTGSTLHAEGVEQICAHYRALGVPVALGGTLATIRRDRCEQWADHLFVGEAEHTWPAFLRDWFAGTPAPVYEQAEHVLLDASPPPDWSLIRAGDYIHLPVQTCRGCPHRCDFCDAVQYLGRKVRTKPVEQVLAEVQNIHATGHHSIFFSDDNFLGKPAFTRELVAALTDWNRLQAHPVAFSTQITMQVADDEALLRALADARFSVLFLGLETVREQSLAEVHKAHNLSRDPEARLARISSYGLVPFVGLIVGFDHDDAGIFDELEQFLERTATPIAGVSLLNAPRNTPLYARLAAAGRLRGDDFSGEWQLQTNIIPAGMSDEQLRLGYARLMRRLYDPAAFERRLDAWLGGIDYFTDIYTRRKQDPRQLLKLGRVLAFCLRGAEPEVRGLFFRKLLWALRNDPRLISRLISFLGQYRHFKEFADGFS